MVSSGSGPVVEAHPGSGAGDDGDTPMDADSPSAAAQAPGTPIVVQVRLPRLYQPAGVSSVLSHAAC